MDGGRRRRAVVRRGLGPERRGVLDPPAGLVQLVEYPLVVVDEQGQRQHAGQRHDGHGEHDGQVERVVLGEHQRAHADGTVLDGLLVEPERHGHEHRERDQPRERGEHGGPAGRQPRPIRRHDDALVPVHADQRERPQQHETAHELQTRNVVIIIIIIIDRRAVSSSSSSLHIYIRGTSGK